MKIINNRFNKSKITGENTFNGDHFEIEDNHELSKDEKSLFWVFLQICDPCFNLYRFSRRLFFLISLKSYFLLLR